jgi:hypothetical protein
VLAAPTNASLPEAGPQALNRYDPTSWTQLYGMAAPEPGAPIGTGLISYLAAHSAGYFYLVAVSTSQQASSIALETGKPVLAAAGFMGTDPALTADKLAALVAAKQVRFVMGLGNGGGMRGGMRGSATDSVSGWIQAHCTAVDPSLYQGQIGGTGLPGGFGGFGGFGRGGAAPLYDCAPQP